MPSHTHGYNRFNYDNWCGFQNLSGRDYNFPYRTDYNWTKSDNVDFKGGNQPHNNMPPYITAYCWRRYR